MPPILLTSLLLICSNVFMTIAWYGFVGKFKDLPWIWLILLSWAVALLEYVFMVPANRLGFAGGLSFPQLRMTQEVISLTVFVLFVWLVRGQALRLDHLWAGLCLVGAVYFVFRGEAPLPAGH
jgi:uncharacterized protein (DUF486 family)